MSMCLTSKEVKYTLDLPDMTMKLPKRHQTVRSSHGDSVKATQYIQSHENDPRIQGWTSQKVIGALDTVLLSHTPLTRRRPRANTRTMTSGHLNSLCSCLGLLRCRRLLGCGFLCGSLLRCGGLLCGGWCGLFGLGDASRFGLGE